MVGRPARRRWASIPMPWLSKPAALRTSGRLVSSTALVRSSASPATWTRPDRRRLVASAERGRGVEHVERGTRGRAVRRPARARSTTRSTSSPTSAARCRPGTFVFVCSDFLAPPEPATWWARALGVSLGRRAGDRAGPGVGAELPARRAARRAVRRPGHGPAPARSACAAARPPRGDRRTRRGSTALLAELRAARARAGRRRRARTSRPSSRRLSGWGETRLAVRRGEW